MFFFSTFHFIFLEYFWCFFLLIFFLNTFVGYIFSVAFDNKFFPIYFKYTHRHTHTNHLNTSFRNYCIFTISQLGTRPVNRKRQFAKAGKRYTLFEFWFSKQITTFLARFSGRKPLRKKRKSVAKRFWESCERDSKAYKRVVPRRSSSLSIFYPDEQFNWKAFPTRLDIDEPLGNWKSCSFDPYQSNAIAFG